jgi:hypothetical protein
MAPELMQVGVLLPVGTALAFAVVLLFCSIEDALRKR